MLDDDHGDPNRSMPADVAHRRSVILAAAVDAATRHGLMAALGTDPCCHTELASVTGNDSRGVRLVLDALTAGGIVDCTPSGYRRPSADGPSSFELLGSGLDQLLSTGEPVVAVDEAEAAQALYSVVVSRIAQFAAVGAARIAERLDPGERVLDVAAGAAPYGLAAARTGATVTLLDLPGVVEQGQWRLADAGWPAEMVAADVFDRSIDPRLERRFDTVIVGGFCRLFSGDRVDGLLRRCASWLVPDGSIYIADAVDGLEARLRGIGLYALDLATRTREGGVHSQAQYVRWLERAGFCDLEVIDTGMAELTILSARLDSGGTP